VGLPSIGVRESYGKLKLMEDAMGTANVDKINTRSWKAVD
jgi:hypothetical protein